MNNINLEDLRTKYLLEGNNYRAKKVIDGYLENDDDYGLQELLKSFKRKSIKNTEEFIENDSLDSFFQYFSILEIAIMIGFVSEDLPVEIKKEIMKYLNNDAIRSYYSFDHYLALPPLLFSRINDALKNEKEYHKEQAFPLFYEFLNISSSVDEDLEVRMFLWLLGGGYIQEFGINDFWEVLNDPEKIGEYLIADSENQTGKIIRGYFKFIDFIFDFNELIGKCRNFPNFRDSMLLYHSYLFGDLHQELSILDSMTFRSTEKMRTELIDNEYNFEKLKEELSETHLQSEEIRRYIRDEDDSTRFKNIINNLSASTLKLMKPVYA